MNKTIKLYDKDAYATSFSAQVLSCEELVCKDQLCYQVILDQTLFFPEEGGQSADTGTLGDALVLDVQIRKDLITHTLNHPLTPGSTVQGTIDWTHRFYNMQQHTGEHIFSGLVHRRFGYDNVGFHLSDQIVTMDFSGPLSALDVEQLETEVNTCIIQNIPIAVTFPTKEELATLDYRSKIEIEGQVRIVTIPGYDICACCAPHVHRTGEIGLLKVQSIQKYKSGVRISILCGFRALANYRMKQTQVTAISNALSAKQETIAAAVTKLKQDLADTKLALGDANRRLMEQTIASLPADQENVCLFTSDLEADIMRYAVNTLVQTRTGYCGIFVGSDTTGYRYIIGTAHGDAREMSKLLRDHFQAKGGGKPEMIQGSLTASSADIQKLFL